MWETLSSHEYWTDIAKEMISRVMSKRRRSVYSPKERVFFEVSERHLLAEQVYFYFGNALRTWSSSHNNNNKRHITWRTTLQCGDSVYAYRTSTLATCNIYGLCSQTWLGKATPDYHASWCLSLLLQVSCIPPSFTFCKSSLILIRIRSYKFTAQKIE